jgi:hypothetical protein
LALQCGLEKTTPSVDTKLLKLQPYTTTVIQNLLPTHYKARIQYCTWWQELEFDGILDPEWMFYSDVAQLTLRDYIKSHNNRY